MALKDELLTGPTGISTKLASAGTAPPFLTPFENVALAFSGGGFRAASFCLGALSYLDQVKFDETSLLEKVRYISSASGGTITSAGFALACAEGQTFPEFFTRLYNKLKGQGLLTRALEILNTDDVWTKNPTKRRNLINAFSLSYNEVLFEGKPLNALKQPVSTPSNKMGVPLEEVCFNTTEFYRGLSFRQQVKIKADSKPDLNFVFGNYYIQVQAAAAGEIKLADALAASSCFPAGFEPMKFPDDLCHPALSREALSAALLINKELLDDRDKDNLDKYGMGLMDGGITDNQGLGSLMLADFRRQELETDFSCFDLILVNDVGSQYMDAYRVPDIPHRSFLLNLSFNTIKGLLLGLLPLLLLLLLWLGWHCSAPIGQAACYVGAGLLLAVVSLFLVIQSKLPNKNTSTAPLNNYTPQVIELLLHFFYKSRLSLLYQMVSARINSTIILNTDVFLKRIRKLIYESFYESPRWANRRKGNHVYDLSFTNDLNRKNQTTPATPDVSENVQIVAQVAFEMPTTLWFEVDKLSNLPCLIAVGQFNTCYNLLEYTNRLLSNPVLIQGLDVAYADRITLIQAVLQQHWEKFKSDPFWMYNASGIDRTLTVKDGKIT